VAPGPAIAGRSRKPLTDNDRAVAKLGVIPLA